MNNYCRNCGEKLDSNCIICPRCGVSVDTNNLIANSDNDSKNANLKNEKVYIVVIIGLYALGFLGNIFGKYINALTYISPIFNLASFIILVYAKVAMPESKKIKSLFSIMIVFMIIYLISLISIIITCSHAITHCR